jgi:Mat/Ecp fimbriae periplasmic chaperone
MNDAFGVVMRFVCFLFAMLASFSVQAIEIDGLTKEIGSKTGSVIQEIQNSDTRTHVITVSVDQVDSPYTMVKIESSGVKQDILFTPVRMVLPPGKKEQVKFFYKGDRDDKEKYFAINWRDEAIATLSEETDATIVPQVDAVATVATALVVHPRKEQFSFKREKGQILNTGNSSFWVTYLYSCKKAGDDNGHCVRNIPFLPGMKEAIPEYVLADSQSKVFIKRSATEFIPVPDTGGV